MGNGYEEKTVEDIMRPIEEYDLVDSNILLCNVLFSLKRVGKDEDNENSARKKNHKTLLVTDEAGKIVGMLGMYDYIRALVPEPVKKMKFSRSYSSLLSSRALEVEEEVSKMKQEHQWLHTSFVDLVKQETGKKVRDIMSPVYPLLKKNDRLNKAIYIMFRENIRQPLVQDKGEIVGILHLIDVFWELIAIAGDECFLSQKQV